MASMSVRYDGQVIHLGTRLYIDGYGFATAMDIGGAIKGNKVDLFFETKEDCYRWGTRNIDVFILSKE
jgi:3D (Asp-Asp-Asp) domain-containing protein